MCSLNLRTSFVREIKRCIKLLLHLSHGITMGHFTLCLNCIIYKMSNSARNNCKQLKAVILWFTKHN